MKYQNMNERIPQEERKGINGKILHLIQTDGAESAGITKEDIYNAYTGDGGLHGLDFKAFGNYHAYSEAKKEVEGGQFLTPHQLCWFANQCIQVEPDALVGDLTCGTGNFFNCIPTEKNAYGCDIDAKAIIVAKYLYPNANIQLGDIRGYDPGIKLSYILGNPPFNLQMEVEPGLPTLSQLYFFKKAAAVMHPLGIMAVIVPASFLADDFSNKSQIESVTEDFNFLGQFGLPSSSFSDVGVDSFNTKLMFWQKKLPEGTETTYRTTMDGTFSSLEELTLEKASEIHNALIAPAKQLLKDNKWTIRKPIEDDSDFFFLVQKMMYQIKVHPATKEKAEKAYAYYEKFLSQTQPASMSWQDWVKVRITEKKVLAYLRKALQSQNKPAPRDEIRLVKGPKGFYKKAYSRKMANKLNEDEKQPVPVYSAVLGDTYEGYVPFQKLLERKRQEYEVQNTPFAEMGLDANIQAYLDDFTVYDSKKQEQIWLTEIQKADINRVIQKKYSILQWQQGSGKTLAGLAVSKYRMEQENFFCTWVVAPAISINNNWDDVLESYGIPYRKITKLADLESIQKGEYAIITINRLCKYKKQIKKWCKWHKVHLLFDECDEITNHTSVRTKAVLSCFRRCKSKFLDSGTVTRNNIAEFAPQLELLYNNSINMISWAKHIYSANPKDEKTNGFVVDAESGLGCRDNHLYGTPIPPYTAGYRLFSSSHLPEKPSVMGIGKFNQDIYNADVLRELIDKTIITRTFEEVAKKDIKTIHQVPVQFTQPERDVFNKAIHEFYQMRSNYFASTGNSRKDTQLALVQQIMLLLRICAAPSSVQEYDGGTPAKIQKVVDMTASWPDTYVAIGVRHVSVLNEYAKAIREAMPDRPLFIVTGSTHTFQARKKLQKELLDSQNGILLCTQQSLPSSVNFEYVDKIILPELHYNDARMSQFYFRFIRFTSTRQKDVYFVTYAGTIESNQMQLVLAKEKLNHFMKGKDVNMDEINEKYGVDFNLINLLMSAEHDEQGHRYLKWGDQKIS